MRHRFFTILALALALGPGTALVLAPAPASAQDAAAGQALFRGKGNCFTCHGREATGGPLAPDLTDDVWVNFDQRPSAAEVEALVKAGVPKPVKHPAPMPPMGGARLSDEEVRQLAAYVLSLADGV